MKALRATDPSIHCVVDSSLDRVSREAWPHNIDCECCGDDKSTSGLATFVACFFAFGKSEESDIVFLLPQVGCLRIYTI